MNQDMDQKLGLFIAFLVMGFFWVLIPMKAVKEDIAFGKEIKKCEQASAEERRIKSAYNIYCDSMRCVNDGMEQDFELSREQKIDDYIHHFSEKESKLESVMFDYIDSIKKYKKLNDSILVGGVNVDTTDVATRIRFFSVESDKLLQKLENLYVQKDKFFDMMYKSKPVYKPVMTFAQFKTYKDNKQNIVRMGYNHKCIYK